MTSPFKTNMFDGGHFETKSMPVIQSRIHISMCRYLFITMYISIQSVQRVYFCVNLNNSESLQPRLITHHHMSHYISRHYTASHIIIHKTNQYGALNLDLIDLKGQSNRVYIQWDLMCHKQLEEFDRKQRRLFFSGQHTALLFIQCYLYSNLEKNTRNFLIKFNFILEFQAYFLVEGHGFIKTSQQMFSCSVDLLSASAYSLVAHMLVK